MNSTVARGIPLRYLLLLLFAMFAGVSALINSYFLWQESNKAMYSQAEHEWRVLADQVQGAIQSMLYRNDEQGIRAQLSSLQIDRSVLRALVIDEQRHVLFAGSRADVGKILDPMSWGLEYKQILSTGLSKKTAGTLLFSEDKTLLFVVFPLAFSEAAESSNPINVDSGHLIIEIDLTPRLTAARKAMHSQMILNASVSVLFGALLWLGVSVLLYRPIIGLGKVVGRLIKDEASPDIPYGHIQEISALRLFVEHMAHTLRRQQQLVIEKESRLREAQLHGGIGAWEWSFGGDHLYWSGNVAVMLGYPEGYQPKGIDDFVRVAIGTDRDALDMALKGPGAEHGSFENLFRVMDATGATRWLMCRGSLRTSAAAQPHSMTGVVQDVTLRVEAENKLQDVIHDLNYYQFALDQHSLVSITGVDGKIHHVNDRYVEISGYSREEIVGLTHRLFKSGMHASGFYKELWDTISSGKTWKGEICNRAKSGNLFWLDTTIIPHANSQGVIESYVAIRGDITEKKKTEEKEAREDALLRMIEATQSAFLSGRDISESYQIILNFLLALTDSEYGFIGEYAADSVLTFRAASNIAWDTDSEALYARMMRGEVRFERLDTLYGTVLDKRSVVIANDAANDPRRGGLPPGHPQLNAFLGIPFVYGGDLIGMVGLANRAEGYDEALVEFIQPLLNTVARIIHADRSERARNDAESRLNNERAFLDAILENVNEGVVAVDAQGRLALVNRRARVFGFRGEHRPPAEWVGATGMCSMDGQLLAAEQVPLLQALSGATISNQEIIFKRRDGGDRFLLANGQPLLDEKGHLLGAVASFRDITQRRAMEADALAAKERQDVLSKQLIQAQKMESLGQLTGGIAHDFNNILASIKGFSSLALSRPVVATDEKLPRYLHEIEKSGDRAAALIKQMLVFGRHADTALQIAAIQEVVDEAMQMVEVALPSSIAVARYRDQKPLYVKCNPVHLHQVVLNLVVNARDAMQGSGELQVSTAMVQVTQQRCQSCLAEFSGDYAKVCVEDSGMGIPAAVMDKMFEPFYTTKDVGKGSGMGMSMVHGIVHQCGGHITVESVVSEGAKICLYFPLHAQRQENDAAPFCALKTAAPADVLQGLRVAVVDDELSVLHYLEELINQWGCHVTTFNESTQALASFQDDPLQFDCVVSDQTMPGLTGTKLASRVFNLRPDLPFLLCSGYSDSVDNVSAQQQGIFAMLNKPIDIARLKDFLLHSAERAKATH